MIRHVLTAVYRFAHITYAQASDAAAAVQEFSQSSEKAKLHGRILRVEYGSAQLNPKPLKAHKPRTRPNAPAQSDYSSAPATSAQPLNTRVVFED